MWSGHIEYERISELGYITMIVHNIAQYLYCTVLCTIRICVDQTFVVAHAELTMIVHYHALSLRGIHTTEQSISVFVGVKFVPLIFHNCKSHSEIKLKSATN